MAKKIVPVDYTSSDFERIKKDLVNSLIFSVGTSGNKSSIWYTIELLLNELAK